MSNERYLLAPIYEPILPRLTGAQAQGTEPATHGEPRTKLCHCSPWPPPQIQGAACICRYLVCRKGRLVPQRSGHQDGGLAHGPLPTAPERHLRSRSAHHCPRLRTAASTVQTATWRPAFGTTDDPDLKPGAQEPWATWYFTQKLDNDSRSQLIGIEHTLLARTLFGVLHPRTPTLFETTPRVAIHVHATD